MGRMTGHSNVMDCLYTRPSDFDFAFRASHRS
jgi:hypothetical protein